MKIVLLGYMGSGKTLVGKELSEKTNIAFIDLDSFIEEKTQQKITDIFSSKGEIYFRKIERECLNELLENPISMIISLGGGTPCYYDTMSNLVENSKVKTIYLNVSLNNLVNRLFLEKENRPLIAHIKNKDELTEFIGKHLFERNSYYNKSELTVNANDTVKKIIENIVIKLF